HPISVATALTARRTNGFLVCIATPLSVGVGNEIVAASIGHNFEYRSNFGQIQNLNGAQFSPRQTSGACNERGD
ncbi:MAG: hypothetical protein ACN6P8_21955, partial [Achromobacter piechaudii]